MATNIKIADLLSSDPTIRAQTASSLGFINPNFDVGQFGTMAPAQRGLTSPNPVARAQTAASLGYVSPMGGGSVSYAAPGGGAGGSFVRPGGGGTAAAGGTPYDKILAQYGSIPTQAGLLANARKTVAAALFGPLQKITNAYKLQQTQLGNQSVRAQEFAKALAQMNMAQAPQLTQEYNTAAQTLGSLGSGLTGTTAADWQTQTAAAQNAVNQMTGGLAGQGVAGYDPAAAANVAQLSGATLPARDIVQQGLNAAANLRSQSAADVMGVGNLAQQYLAKISDASATAESQKADLAAQQPGLVQKALDSLRTDRQNQIKFLTDVETAKANYMTNQATTKDASKLNWARIALSGDQIKQGNLTNWRNWTLDKAKLKQSDIQLATRQADQTFNHALSLAQEGRLENSAAAYNNYLTGKTTIDKAKLVEKGTYDAATVKIRSQANEIAKINAQLKQNNYYFNPKSKTVQPIPSGTFIGKDGLPHDATPGRGAAAKAATTVSATDIATLPKEMTNAIKQRLKISVLTPPKQQVRWTKPQITQWLQRKYGTALLVRYPTEKKWINDTIGSIADDVIAAYPTLK